MMMSFPDLNLLKPDGGSSRGSWSAMLRLEADQPGHPDKDEMPYPDGNTVAGSSVMNVQYEHGHADGNSTQGHRCHQIRN